MKTQKMQVTLNEIRRMQELAGIKPLNEYYKVNHIEPYLGEGFNQNDFIDLVDKYVRDTFIDWTRALSDERRGRYRETYRNWNEKLSSEGLAEYAYEDFVGGVEDITYTDSTTPQKVKPELFEDKQALKQLEAIIDSISKQIVEEHFDDIDYRTDIYRYYGVKRRGEE